MLKKLKQVINIISAYLFKNECAFLRIVESEATDYLKCCERLGIKDTEDVQDLLFHIHSYFEIPKSVRLTMFQNIPENLRVKIKKGEIKLESNSSVSLASTYADYLEEVEKQRMVERVCILECMKNVPFSSIF